MALTLTTSLFSANRTGGHPAGLFVGSGSIASVENCTFDANSTPGNGASIFNGASPVTIRSCTFSGNGADNGPAIFKGQDATIPEATGAGSTAPTTTVE